MMSICEFAAAHGMIVFNHCWKADVLRYIAGRFPNTPFICGHYAARYDPVIKERPNVYANIWNVSPLGWIDRGVGADRFILGSDGFMNPLSAGIGLVAFGRMTDDEKRSLLGLNMARLLDSVGALPNAVKEQYLNG